MFNCRSVSPKTWEFARQALVFYFTRRHGLVGAEDLAHETLAAILKREDYQFEQEEDFLKVCYGFASHILQSARREDFRGADSSLECSLASPAVHTGGLNDTELNIYLDEVLRLGQDQLRETDWQLIQQAIVLDGGRVEELDPAGANSARVKLHRARKKLATLAGGRNGNV